MNRDSLMSCKPAITLSRPIFKEKNMHRTAQSFTALAIASLALSPLAVNAATITWDGGGGDDLWSTDTNWTGVPDDTAPTTTDVAAFNDVGSGTQTTTSDTVRTIQALRINQTTTTAVNRIELGANLTLSNNNALQYNSTTGGGTLANAAMFVLDLNGNDLILSSTTAAGVQTFFGTYRFDTTGSDIYSNWAIGTSGGNSLTFNVGTTSPSQLLATGANVVGRFGQIAATGGATNNNRPFTVNFGANSTVDVENGAELQIARIGRHDTHTYTVNNAGAINVAANSKLTFLVDSGTGSGTTTMNITNQVGGTLTQVGDIDITRLRSGASSSHGGAISFSNAGTWIISGTGADLSLRFITNGSSATTTFTNSGTLRGATANDQLNFNRYHGVNLQATLATLTNTGVISPGAGQNGDDLDSVGTLTLQDFDVTFSGVNAALRIDLGGTANGEFDVLTLTNGALTLDADSNLELYYVNGFDGSVGGSWTILNYTSVNGAFDLVNNLTITGGAGVATDSANYSINYGANSAVLTLVVPEPASLALLAVGGLLILPRRSRA